MREDGYSLWNKEGLRTKLQRTISDQPQPSMLGNGDIGLLLDNQMPDGGMFALHLGYNISGHLAVEGSFMMHPGP